MAMPTLLRDERGYIDPIASVLPFALLAVLVANPRIIAVVGDGLPVGLSSWVRSLAIVGVLLFVQVSAIAVCIGEAHQDAKSRGDRVGFNRAPALQGITAPLVLALVYIVGLWPLLRLEPRPIWAIVLNVVVAVGILGGGLAAAKR